MINKKELRIGNLVKNEDGTICPVASIIARSWDDEIVGVIEVGAICKGSNRQLEKFEAIPLAPEVLEKITHSHLDRYKVILGEFVFDRSAGGTGLIFKYECWNSPKSRQVTLMYVHQLQNLYYDLTGEELILTDIIVDKEFSKQPK